MGGFEYREYLRILAVIVSCPSAFTVLLRQSGESRLGAFLISVTPVWVTLLQLMLGEQGMNVLGGFIVAIWVIPICGATAAVSGGKAKPDDSSR